MRFSFSKILACSTQCFNAFLGLFVGSIEEVILGFDAFTVVGR